LRSRIPIAILFILVASIGTIGPSISIKPMTLIDPTNQGLVSSLILRSANPNETFAGSAQAQTEADNSWPLYHHDLGQTGFTKSSAPTTNETYWVSKPSILGVRAPVIVDGMVFVQESFATIPNDYFNVYGLNEGSGVTLWTFQAHTGGTQLEPEGSQSIAIAYGRVYFGSYAGQVLNVYSLNESTGQLLWSHPMTAGTWAGPTVADGQVFIASLDGKLYSLNSTTGTLIWSYTTGNQLWSTPVVLNGEVIFQSDDGHVYALNERDGHLLWSDPTHQGYYTSGGGLAVSNGAVFVGDSSGFAWAFNQTDGSQIWSTKLPSGGVSEPSVGYGRVYFSDFTYNTGPKIYALNQTDGNLLWTIKSTEGEPLYSPAIADGMVFVGATAWNATNGAPIWNYENELGGFPAVADGRLYVALDTDFLQSFGQANPLALTSFNSNATVFVNQPRIYTAAYAGGVGPFQCTFNFGDGTTSIVSTLQQYCSMTHTYSVTGNFTATVEVLGTQLGNIVNDAISFSVQPQPVFVGNKLSWKKHVASLGSETFKAKVDNPSVLNLLILIDFTVVLPQGTLTTFSSPSFLLQGGVLKSSIGFVYSPPDGIGTYCFTAVLVYGLDTGTGVLDAPMVLGMSSTITGCFNYS